MVVGLPLRHLLLLLINLFLLPFVCMHATCRDGTGWRSKSSWFSGSTPSCGSPTGARYVPSSAKLLLWFNCDPFLLDSVRRICEHGFCTDVMWGFPSLLQVLEIRPTIKWDKGKALEFLLESLGKQAQTPFAAAFTE